MARHAAAFFMSNVGRDALALAEQRLRHRPLQADAAGIDLFITVPASKACEIALRTFSSSSGGFFVFMTT